MADKIYNLPAGTVSKKTHPAERQDGKTGELAFGYQGALGAWLKFDSSGRHSDERIVEICKAWRAEHPAIVQLWYDLQDAAINAVNDPGLVAQLTQCDVGFEVVDEWLSMILPSGKRLWYYNPMLVSAMPQWHQPATKPACRAGTCSCEPRAQLAYMSQKNGQWKRVRTYGGKLTENLVQATSREIMMPAAVRLEEAGYPVILTVYDEAVTEPPIGFGSKEELEAIMAIMPEWAAGWPITVDAWEGDRYLK
jgi:DNA polymerase